MKEENKMNENCEHEFEHILEETKNNILSSSDISQYVIKSDKAIDIIDSSKNKNTKYICSVCKKCGKLIYPPSLPCVHNFKEVYDETEKINLSEEEIAKILNTKISLFGKDAYDLCHLIESAKTVDKKLVKIYCEKCGLTIG